MLERAGGERLLVVESGTPPVKAVQRAVHWDEIDRIDHDAVAVWLTLDGGAFERQALDLDPANAIEEGDGQPEARRISVAPEGEIPEAQTIPVRGPVDRTAWSKAFAGFALMAFTALLATLVVFFTGDNTWALLYLVPALLAAVTAVIGYRTYREPYEPRPARKP
ncbi:MAG: hypothetical protein HOQ03_04760 [Thermoleophilia bacterium]|nr:hypothetical protein [Thermoleophilia bacterium]